MASGASTSAASDAHHEIARVRLRRAAGAAFVFAHDPVFATSPPKRRSRLAIFGDRAFQRRLVEIGPVDRHEDQFAIGGLPHQEIRQPLLAAGADDEIGIGNVGRIEIAPERVGVDRCGIALAVGDFAREPLRGVARFPAASRS